MASKKRQKVIVRTTSAGVHFGELVSRKGQEVVLANAKRIWQWFGANTLNEIALRGVEPKSKVSDAVTEITLTQAIEIIVCNPAGAASLERSGWAK
jgi:hypothetical protein